MGPEKGAGKGGRQDRAIDTGGRHDDGHRDKGGAKTGAIGTGAAVTTAIGTGSRQDGSHWHSGPPPWQPPNAEMGANGAPKTAGGRQDKSH